MTQDASVGERATRGIVWTLGERWLSRVIDTVLIVVLARLLSPSDFGVVAIATAILALLDLLRNAGFSEAAVQRKDMDKRHYDAIFWWSLGIGLLLAGVLVLAAGWLGSLFDSDDLPGVLRLLAIGLPLQALLLVPTVRLERALQFKPIAVRGIIGVASGGAVGVVLAMDGAGPYALAGRALADLAVSVVVLWALTRHWPGVSFAFRDVRDLLAFGIKLMGYRFLDFVQGRSDDFIIGAWIGSSALGIYSVAYRIYRILTEVLLTSISRVALPVFATLQDEPSRMRNAYYQAIRFTAMAVAPIFAGFAVCADGVIHVLFGAKWDDAVPVMQVLSFVGVLHSIRYYDGSLLIAVGQPGPLVRLKLCSTVVTVIGFFGAALTGSLVAFAAVYAGVAWLFSLPLWVWALHRYAGIEPRRTFDAVKSPIAGTAILAGVGFLANESLAELSRGELLAAQAFILPMVYVLAMLSVDPRGFRQFVARIRGMVRPARSPSTVG